jgi:hypothetical protein
MASACAVASSVTRLSISWRSRLIASSWAASRSQSSAEEDKSSFSGKEASAKRPLALMRGPRR